MQYLKCPFTKMAITQFDNGSTSHRGSYAWDISSGTAGLRSPYYAPCDVVCKEVDLTYASTWWESIDKVEFADGTIDYATFLFCHDSSIDCYVGQTIKQGTQIGNMGDSGNVSKGAVHCHVEVAKGKYQGKWYKNSYGVWCLYNAIKFYKAFYMDNVEIVDYSNPNDSRKPLLEDAKLHFIYKDKLNIKVNVDNLNMRKEASTTSESLGYIPKGIYSCDSKVISGGYTWYKLYNCYIASNGEWVSEITEYNQTGHWQLDEFMAELDKRMAEPNVYKLGGIGRHDKETGIRTYDCVGIFKSILWNYDTQTNLYDKTYPDTNVGGVKKRVENSVMPFDKTKMKKGMLVFRKTEHIGMVYDDTHIIETTPIFENCLQLTTPEMREENGTEWIEMAYADFIDYPKEDDNNESNAIVELEERIRMLEKENEDLKSKLKEIKSIATID